MRNWFQKLLYGRYGGDQLGRALLVGSLVALVLELFTGWGFLNILALLLLVVSYIRIFSRNLVARRAENEVFLRWWNPTRQKLAGLGGSMRDMKTHVHCKCPTCGQKIRVPRGRGKISIHCPKCNVDFLKKT